METPFRSMVFSFRQLLQGSKLVVLSASVLISKMPSTRENTIIRIGWKVGEDGDGWNRNGTVPSTADSS